MADFNSVNVTVQEENHNMNGASSSTPDVIPPENHPVRSIYRPMTPGTIIPNRIFVNGFDCKVTEHDLRCFFSQHGAVTDVKIMIDRMGVSKGYGFITFEKQEDAQKLLNNVNGICLRDKRLCIGQAVEKSHTPKRTKSPSVASPEPAVPQLMSRGPLCLTTSTGHPYTYHNGVAYFHSPSLSPPAYHWPPAPQLMPPQSPQPVYQQPAYYHYQYVPNQYQWNALQLPMPSSPVVFPQRSEYLFQPVDGGFFQPPVPVLEDATPEFVEQTVQRVYPMFSQRGDGLTPIVLQRDPGMNPMFSPLLDHLKPKSRRFFHRKNHHRYLPE